ncbi:hypothetical protein JIN85_12035 [Luteolibacter pohnpeiensis]|uniref:Glycoside hydrolase family 42 N-terminal domain-containing protein n=2 Tax=Luteolibacter pohnpeiensis TaxID=454153 RepID=A0A934S5U5_9BACT|nr:hypothetical protein [Luteolibacter pohnpeiensis]
MVKFGCWLLPLLLVSHAVAESIWIEGESAVDSTAVKHPWYHSQVDRKQLSGGDFISHFSKDHPGEVGYDFEVNSAGEFDFWVRANPVQSKIGYQLDSGESEWIDMSRRQTGSVNIASDGKPDLRFIAWAYVGRVTLKAGKHHLSFTFDSTNEYHGSLDCFVFAPPDFQPIGVLKPDEIEAHQRELAESNDGWVPWISNQDAAGESPINLRRLNEKFAGEHGGIATRGADFIYRDSGEVVRFWGVNGPPVSLHGEELAACARMLASHGVNLVRIHGAVFDPKTGVLDAAKVAHVREIVAAMKKEGIYSHLSVYFPLWLSPEPGPGWREGYDGNMHPFALLYFEPEFQKLYRSWVEALLKQPGSDSHALIDEPAVMGIELINEDSFFFWTFSEKNIPPAQLAKLEAMFAKWAAAKYGSLPAAHQAWHGMKLPHDADDALGIRPLYQIFTDKTQRDQDTAAFLLETQRGFYETTSKWLRNLGYEGLITASNWTTANQAILGPLEKYSYTPGDFIDRHGYFGCHLEGDNASWSIRNGQTYGDRSALRFDPEKPGDSKDFSHPAIDPTYFGKPSMISETTWNRPNRYRGEAPLFYAAYGALQGSDALVHFALDGAQWSVKPGYFMQPWTLMSPTQMGQFPAAALIFRQGLVHPGEVVADLSLTLTDALALKGSPLVPVANLDELRKQDVQDQGDAGNISTGIDPLAFFAGRTALGIGAEKKADRVADLSDLIHREKQEVRSRDGELKLDYGKGLLRLNAPAAQGAVGNLKEGGVIDLTDVEIRSPLEIGEIVAVSLDGKPLADSESILLQVMSEEKANGFATEPAGEGLKRIINIGSDPWLIRQLAGTVRFKRADAAKLEVRQLDINGRLQKPLGTADQIQLQPATAYYWITKS